MVHEEAPAHGKRGIGLPLVRRLAERQGGSARVDEAEGGGAEFTVVLPEALTEPDPEPESRHSHIAEAEHMRVPDTEPSPAPATTTATGASAAPEESR